MTKTDTRLALMEAGIQILRAKGYNNTGIQEVLQQAGVPKGSFYHYFASKEDFGLQIINHEAVAHAQVVSRYLQDTRLTPLTRLRYYFESKTHEFAQQQCRFGCLLGNLGQELGDQNEVFRTRLATLFTEWRHTFRDVLLQAQQQGEIAAHFDPEILAEFCLSGWEGALMQMKVIKSPQPLHTFITLFFDHLLALPPASHP